MNKDENDENCDNKQLFVLQFLDDASYYIGNGFDSKSLKEAKVYLTREDAESDSKGIDESKILTYDEALLLEEQKGNMPRKNVLCVACMERCNHLAGDASLWPTVVGYKNGVAVYLHIKCCAQIIKVVRPELL